MDDYIKEHYSECKNKNYCLLCSENEYEHCHRSLIANKIKKVFDDITIINLK